MEDGVFVNALNALDAFNAFNALSSLSGFHALNVPNALNACNALHALSAFTILNTLNAPNACNPLNACKEGKKGRRCLRVEGFGRVSVCGIALIARALGGSRCVALRLSRVWRVAHVLRRWRVQRASKLSCV